MPKLFFTEKHEVLEVTGPDAKDFLHRISSADFKKLSPGFWTPATLLNPTGKVVLYFWALQRSLDSYFMLIPPSTDGFDRNKPPSQTAFEIFDKLFFRENLKLTAHSNLWSWIRIVSDSALSGILQPLNTLSKSEFCTIDESTLGLNPARWRSGNLHDYGLLTKEAPKWTTYLETQGYKKSENLDYYRIEAFDPGVPNELNLKTIPLEADLDDAVHENKGCFPGQEVIERIRSMGQVPRMLVKIVGTGTAPSLPSNIQADGVDAGVLTSVSANPDKTSWIGLGFLKRTFNKPESIYTLAGQSVQIKTKSNLH